MARQDYIFTSESVSEGHPDKICDRVSDAVVDAYLSTDQADFVRCGVETLVTTNFVCIAGETRGPESVDHALMEKLAREAIKDIGYDQDNFHWRDMDVLVKVHSPVSYTHLRAHET